MVIREINSATIETDLAIKDQQIASLVNGNRRALEEWAKQNPGKELGELPEELWPALVPRRAYEISGNLGNVKNLGLKQETGRLHFITYESNYSNPQSDPEEWANWIKKKQAAEETVEGFSPTVQPTAGIDPLQASFSSLYEKGILKPDDRILFELNAGRPSPEILNIGHIDGQRHQGLANDFYLNSLPTLAKPLGIRFITGVHNGGNISFFTNPPDHPDKPGLGGIPLRKIKPELRTNLFPNVEASIFEESNQYNSLDLYAVQFLNDEDKEKYLI